MESALKNWDDTKTSDENIKQFNGYVPGVTYRPEREEQLREVLKYHPKCEHIIEAIKELHQWCHNGGFIVRNEEPLGVTDYSDWKSAFDLRPWTAFPERS